MLTGIDGYITMEANVDVKVIDPIHVSSTELKTGEAADITIDAPSYPYQALVTMFGTYVNGITDNDGNGVPSAEGELFGNPVTIPGTGDAVSGDFNIINWYWVDAAQPYGQTGYDTVGHIPATNSQSTDTRMIELEDIAAGNYYKAFEYGYTVSDEDIAKLAEYGLTLEKVMTDSGYSYDVNTGLKISGTPAQAGTVEFGVTLNLPLARGFGSAFPNNVKVCSPAYVQIPTTVTLTIAE